MLARYAVLPPPARASGSQVLLLSKLKAPINHAESTLLQVFFLKNLKPFGINTYEKQGEGSPLWLTNCSKKVSARNFAGIPTSHLPYTLPSSVSRNFFACHSYENTGGVGVFFPFRNSSLATHHSPLSFTVRCIIPPREYPAERNGVSRPRLLDRKRNHHPRILSPFPERSSQRLQPEIKPRSRHESRRSRRPPGPSFPGRTVPGPLRQRFGQPRHQVRTPSPGSFQLLSPRNRHPVRVVAARPADTRRTSHSHRTHAFLRRFERRAIQPQPFDEARAPARQSSSPATGHQRIPLRPSLVRRRGSLRAEVRSRSERNH